MLRRKRPRMLRKRRLMDVGASRRRIKRNMAVLKLFRRQREFNQLVASPAPATATAEICN